MKARPPFTVAWVREAIEGLGDQYRVPPESRLRWLVNWLNGDAFIYTWKGRPKVHDFEVLNALEVLARYHEGRWKELLAGAPHLRPHIVERETQLRDKFNAYSEEMIRLRARGLAYLPAEAEVLYAPFESWLPMDLAALYASFKSWHDIAGGIACVFAETMKESNPGKPFGNSDKGPVVRFTTAALNLIGILPHADRLEDLYPRVAKHLRMTKAEDQKKIGRQAPAVKEKKRKGKQGLYETRK